MSSGRHPKSRCNTPSTALRGPQQAGETALRIRGTAACSYPGLQPLLILQEETGSFSPSWGPSRRPLEAWPGGPVGPGGRQGRPLLYQEPPPGVEGREEETPPSLPVASPWGSPAGQGLQVLPIGPTSDASPPLLHHHLPQGVIAGVPPCCPLTPASSLAGRGGDPGGLALQCGTHKKFGRLIASSLPQVLLPAQCMSPWPEQQARLAGGLGRGL